MEEPQQLKLDQVVGDASAMQSIHGGPKVQPTTAEQVHIMSTGCFFPGACYHQDGAWTAWHTASDGFIDIPTSRWDHSLYYSNNINDKKTTTRHAALLPIADLEAFDNEYFGFTPQEAWQLALGHRAMLEVVMEML